LLLAEFMPAFDATLARAGLQCHGGTPRIERTYTGAIGGRQARAKLSVTTDQNDVRYGTGFYLTIEVDTGLPARLAAGRNVPLLVGRGLEELPGVWPAIPNVALRAHDHQWARRFCDDQQTAGAMTSILQRAEYIEHRPGTLQLMIQDRPLSTECFNWLPPLVSAFGFVTQAAMMPPAPTPAPTRWSDNRALLVAVISLGVITLLIILVALSIVVATS
jgi:hypothetical protein